MKRSEGKEQDILSPLVSWMEASNSAPDGSTDVSRSWWPDHTSMCESLPVDDSNSNSINNGSKTPNS